MSDVAMRLRALAARFAQDAGAAPDVRREALELHRTQQLQSPADRLAAAALLVASDDRAEVAVAQELAMGAFGALPAARPLAAAAFDRLRLLAGAPQKFGTQWVARAGGWEMWEVDASTTDSERAKWGLPGLGELRARRWGGLG